MSTPKRTHAQSTTLTVDRPTAAVLRIEAKKILMFGHEPFENFLDLSPDAQYALAMRFQDTIDLISTVGWNPRSSQAMANTYDISLTDDLVKELAHRRLDLGASITDRLSDFEGDESLPTDVLAELTDDRHAATTLDRIIGSYSVAAAARTT
jgi:hypothetical protein